MRKTIIGLIFLLVVLGVVAQENLTEKDAVCITQENKAIKNGVDFPNFCVDENNLVENICENDTVIQKYVYCDVCSGTTCVTADDWIYYNQTNQTENQTVIENQTKVSCEDEWTCGNWEDCVDDKQTRVCTKINDCEKNDNKPVEEQACIVPVTPWYNTWIGMVLMSVSVVIVIVGFYFLLREKEE